MLVAAGLVTRIFFIAAPPVLSGDVYRYMWDGRAIRHGMNPFTYHPAHPDAASLRDENHGNLNNTAVKTVYPPFAQAAFAATGAVSDTATAFKATAAFFDLGVAALIVLLLRRKRLPAGRAAAWMASPVVLMEFAGHGHGDAQGIFFLMLAIFLIDYGTERPPIVALTAGILSKFYPVVFVPLFAVRMRHRRFLWAIPILFVAAYLPFAGAGRDLVAGLFRYADAWAFNGSVYDLLLGWTGEPARGETRDRRDSRRRRRVDGVAKNRSSRRGIGDRIVVDSRYADGAALVFDVGAVLSAVFGLARDLLARLRHAVRASGVPPPFERRGIRPRRFCARDAVSAGGAAGVLGSAAPVNRPSVRGGRRGASVIPSRFPRSSRFPARARYRP
ncbi:MAG: hypothetical protein M5R36_06065 [Deltaproteobacteria bacterium]|nr:hypothetical protein [Deltaproteobacteria bacterium]